MSGVGFCCGDNLFGFVCKFFFSLFIDNGGYHIGDVTTELSDLLDNGRAGENPSQTRH
jgi:hypothetical protein